MSVPNVGDYYTRKYQSGHIQGYQVVNVNPEKKRVYLKPVGRPDLEPLSVSYNPEIGDLNMYEHVSMPPGSDRFGGKNRSRIKRRKNKRKTVRRNKFMKWF